MASWSGFWGDSQNTTGTYALRTNKAPLFRGLLPVAFRKAAMRVNKELALKLTGAVAGASASATHKRIAGDPNAGSPIGSGGSRTIETVTDINRVTAAADETLIDNMMNQKSRVATYPADLSGNGGHAYTPS